MTSTWQQHVTADMLAAEQRQIGKLVASGTMTPEQAKVEARGWVKIKAQQAAIIANMR